jgi:hypothetical protein
MPKLELESNLEERCVQIVERLGGMALKLQIPGVRGFPDRTILMPGAKVWFAEFKRIKSGRVSSQQLRWIERLGRAGFPAYVIDNEDDFEKALRKETNAQEI